MVRQAVNLPEVADQILGASGKDPQISLGPLVWVPGDGVSDKRWYFNVVAPDVGEGDGCRIYRIECGDDEHEGTQVREALRFELVRRGHPTVIHDFDDELEMLRWSEVLWPSERLAELRARIIAERKGSPS